MATPTPRVFAVNDNPAMANVRWVTNYITYRQVRGNDLQRLLDELAITGGTNQVASWTTAQARGIAGIFVADPANSVPGVSPDFPIP